MKALAWLITCVILAAIPASIGLVGNAEFTQAIPIRPPASAILLDGHGRPLSADTGRERRATDHATLRAKHRHRPRSRPRHDEAPGGSSPGSGSVRDQRRHAEDGPDIERHGAHEAHPPRARSESGGARPQHRAYRRSGTAHHRSTEPVDRGRHSGGHSGGYSGGSGDDTGDDTGDDSGGSGDGSGGSGAADQ